LGIKPGGGQPAPYQYDQNGNLTLDTDKSLSISYSFLKMGRAWTEPEKKKAPGNPALS